MILVQVQQTWLQVLTGSTTADEAILAEWPGIGERDLARHGDVLLGLYRNTVVGVYDIDRERTTVVEGKAKFAGTPSTTWAHLVGKPNPGQPWGPQGATGLVQFVDTPAVAAAGAPVANVAAAGVPVPTASSGRQAVLDGFVLTVDAQGNAVVLVPAGRTLTMQTAPPTAPVGA